MYQMTIELKEDNKYHVTYQIGRLGGSEYFDTVTEASAFVSGLEIAYTDTHNRPLDEAYEQEKTTN